VNKISCKSAHGGPGESFDRNKPIPLVVNIPDKLYFKIGEVSAITGVETHVLRYWESELKVIRPQRASSNQRLYRRVDIENILTIKKLLQEDGYTIPGARKFLSARKKRGRQTGKEVKRKPRIPEFLHEVKSELEEIKRILKA